MPRAHVDGLKTWEVAEEEITEGAFAGTRRRLLSIDEETGAYTAISTITAGWSAALDAEDGLLEVFVLDGKLHARGTDLGRGFYLRAERFESAEDLMAPESSEVLLMVDPSLHPDGDESPVVILDTERLRYESPEGLGGFAGTAIKPLWTDTSRGPRAQITAGVARKYIPKAEFHDTVEEFYLIFGDITDSDTGVERTTGCYTWREPFYTHGPAWTEQGNLTFLRSHGDLYCYWHDNPHATPEENKKVFEETKVEK